jgi:hypothetical protein
MSKSKKRNRRELNKALVPWWKKTWAKFALIPVGTILAVWGSISTYKSSGAEELRTQIYQPLYADILSLEESTKAVSREKLPVMKALPALRRTGAIEQIPGRIQSRLVKISEEAQRIHTAVTAVNEFIIREMSSRITQVRSDSIDRTWNQKASEIIRQLSASGKGISDSVTLFSAYSHSGRSRSIDVRDPAKPVIGGPGGPTFVLGDWLTYPASISTIEQLWTDIDYLYFNETTDFWYYRLKREDLKRTNTTLTIFLKPVYEILGQNADFQLLLSARPALLSEITDIKATLVERIRDPKHLGDIVSR